MAKCNQLTSLHFKELKPQRSINKDICNVSLWRYVTSCIQILYSHFSTQHIQTSNVLAKTAKTDNFVRFCTEMASQPRTSFKSNQMRRRYSAAIGRAWRGKGITGRWSLCRLGSVCDEHCTSYRECGRQEDNSNGRQNPTSIPGHSPVCTWQKWIALVHCKN